MGKDSLQKRNITSCETLYYQNYRIQADIGVIARADSWKRIPFVEGELVPFSRKFSVSEYAKISEGLIPKAMEDKWFIYFERPYLYMHRSWTGEPIFRISLIEAIDGAKADNALWAPHGRKFGEADIEYQVALLNFLISNLLLKEKLPFPMPRNIKEPAKGVYQHHVSGTGYPQQIVASAEKRRWWKFW